MTIKMTKNVVAIILLSMLLVGCSNRGESKIMEEVLESATAFDFENDATNIPDELVETFSKYKLILMGEIHYVKEHQVFMGHLIQRLHSEGFRYYVQETGSSNSVLVDYYVKGQLETLPPAVLNLDKSFIRLIYDFNESLREAGREDEQISYIGFDMNHPMDAYSIAINALAEKYDNSKLRIYRRDLRDQSGNAHGYRNLLVQFLGDIQEYELTNDQLETLKWVTQNELDSLDIRINWDDDAREAYIEREVVRAIDLSGDEEKLLVNCGSWHAQLIPHWVMNSDKEFQWLGMRLNRYFETREDDFYSLSVTAYEGERKRNIWSDERLSYELSGRQSSINVVNAFKEQFGEHYVFLDYKNLNGVEGDILIEYPSNMVKMKPNSQFNGLLVYPHISVPDELKYYE